MDPDDIKAHWRDWATSYGTGLRATTKSSTAKEMEVDALTRAIRRISDGGGGHRSVLEVGCGNGQNCLRLAGEFPALRFTGVDYVPEMIAAADAARVEAGMDDGRLRFVEDDVLTLDHVDDGYDIIFTDRCLINLNTGGLQARAISNLCALLSPGGFLLMIENSRQTHARQNRARDVVGLEPRTPAAYNLFFDEDVILPHIRGEHMEILEIEDFISLHDLMLYVFVPLLNGGNVDYEHPLVEAATKLGIFTSTEARSAFGDFGQNRLYVCRKQG